jgi:hypothetical protein
VTLCTTALHEWPTVTDALAGLDHDAKNPLHVHPRLSSMKPGRPFRPSGMLEFEPVSIAKARAVANRLPGGVEALLDRTPHGWEKVREPLAAEELKLKPTTVAWLRSLPKYALPVEAAMAFPRVVNRIADTWNDKDELEVVWESLLHDTRKNRRGFPAKVRAEFETLRALSAAPSQPAGTP